MSNYIKASVYNSGTPNEFKQAFHNARREKVRKTKGGMYEKYIDLTIKKPDNNKYQLVNGFVINTRPKVNA